MSAEDRRQYHDDEFGGGDLRERPDDFHDADFHGVDFDGVNAESVSFSRSKFLLGAVSNEYGGRQVHRPTTFRNASANYANFTDAEFVRAEISGDLRAALFTRTNFGGTSVRGARFQDCDFTDAKMAGAQDLQSDQLGGAVLTGADLPPAVGKWRVLENVDELIRRAGKLLSLILLVALYGLITAFFTSDVELLTDASTVTIPTIGAAASATAIGRWLPLAVILMFAYFQIYLTDLWGRLGTLPAVFEDGTPLHRRVLPWPVGTVVRRYMFRLLARDAHLPSSYVLLPHAMACALAWWIPATLSFLMWLRYVQLHDWSVTWWHIGMLTVSVAGAPLLHLNARQRMNGGSKAGRFWRWRHAYRIGLPALVVLLAIWVSSAAMAGSIPWLNLNVQGETLSSIGGNAMRFERRNFRGIRARDARFRQRDIVVVYDSCDFSGADLRDADIGGARFTNSDFSGSDLTGAELSYYSGVEGVLDSTVFDCADLRGSRIDWDSYFWRISSVKFAAVDRLTDGAGSLLAEGAMRVDNEAEYATWRDSVAAYMSRRK